MMTQLLKRRLVAEKKCFIVEFGFQQKLHFRGPLSTVVPIPRYPNCIYPLHQVLLGLNHFFHLSFCSLLSNSCSFQILMLLGYFRVIGIYLNSYQMIFDPNLFVFKPNKNNMDILLTYFVQNCFVLIIVACNYDFKIKSLYLTIR